MAVSEDFDPTKAHVTSQWKHDRPLNACRFDPEGRFVICGSEDANVERFNLPDGACTVMTGGHTTWVRSVAFSQDGANAITAGCDGKITWWEPAAEQPTVIRSVDAHKGWVRSMDVSPDGALLASGGNDNTIRLWNVADGTLVRELTGHQRHVYSVAFHPEGEFLLSGDLTGGLKQWDVASGEERRTFDAAALHSYNGGQKVDFGGIRAIAVNPDGKSLAAGGLHKATNPLGAVHEPLVLLFDWETQEIKQQHVIETTTRGVIWRLKWLQDGSLLGLSSGASGGYLVFWKPEADKAYHRFKLPHLARDMDVHEDGLQVATAHYDRQLRITRLAAKTA